MRKLLQLTIVLVLLGLTLLSACTSSQTPATTETAAATTATTTTANPTISPSQPAGGGVAEPGVPNPVIQIYYRPLIMIQGGVGSVLSVNISIDNVGYKTFNTSPDKFSVMINNQKYDYYPEGTDLRALDIPNGGKINARLAFVVPQSAASPKVGYTLVYSGDYVYNVQWIKRN
jgi:hypothetical protein